MKMYEIPKFATVIEGESLTEQEHIPSCDITKMVRDASRGIQIRGSSSQPIYGEDDTTMDGLQHRINKEKIEQELAKAAKENEFTEEELKHIPPNFKQKFGFKTKKQPASTKNDDLTTKTEAPTTKSSPSPEPPKNP